MKVLSATSDVFCFHPTNVAKMQFAQKICLCKNHEEINISQEKIKIRVWYFRLHRFNLNKRNNPYI